MDARMAALEGENRMLKHSMQEIRIENAQLRKDVIELRSEI